MAEVNINQPTALQNAVSEQPKEPVLTHPRLAGPIHAERPMKIICIGAGASGLLFAYKIQRSFDTFDLTVYEKNAEISGTWTENRYPGCACDVPSHQYNWSFEPNPNWSSVYAGSKEIFEYFDNFSKKYNLGKYCQLSHQVTGAIWDNQAGRWDVEVANLTNGHTFHDSCDILINASGILNAWKWPEIPGLETFKGPLLHSARWDESIDLRGKTVGLIGNGSSAIQILPTIQPHVKKLVACIREPTWVSPTRGQTQYEYTAEEKRKFAEDPDAFTEYRKEGERSLNQFFPLFIKGSSVQHESFKQMTAAMKEKLHNPQLEELLIPEWPVGGRRITPGVGYLEALGEPNVEVAYGSVDEITSNGIRCSNGKNYDLDVLICATGFDVSFRPRFPVIGLDGHNLQDLWSDLPKGYLGLAAPQMPNYLVFLGPNCPAGNGPVLSAIECQADYMLKFCDRWQTENIRAFWPKMEAIEDFVKHKDYIMEKMIWSDPRYRSWYKRGQSTGPVTALWPGSTLHYIETISKTRWEDWNIEYEGNRFAYLGNGYSQTELDETADSAYYIRPYDDSPPLSTARQRRILTKSGTRQPPSADTNYAGPKL